MSIQISKYSLSTFKAYPSEILEHGEPREETRKFLREKGICHTQKIRKQNGSELLNSSVRASIMHGCLQSDEGKSAIIFMLLLHLAVWPLC
jgi:hypothetical protein